MPTQEVGCVTVTKMDCRFGPNPVEYCVEPGCHCFFDMLRAISYAEWLATKSETALYIDTEMAAEYVASKTQ